jgi:hypothetical protein
VKAKGWNADFLTVDLTRDEAVVLMRLLAYWTDDIPTLRALGAVKPGVSFRGVSVPLTDDEAKVADRCLMSMARELQRTIAARTRMQGRAAANADLSFVCERCLNEAPTTGGADG